MKKIKSTLLMVIALVVLIAIAVFVFPLLKQEEVVPECLSTSQLEKAINISQLSTAEFIYNGIAEKHNDNNPDEIDCYISYNANVKVGIDMKDVKFIINETEKTVTPILPDISVNIAILDENEISYIPKNPDIALKDVIAVCKEDALTEANASEILYQTAEDNLKDVIKALIAPVLNDAGYSIDWNTEQ